MSWKYNSPEWKRSPLRAQIDEALREVEQVKAALQALQRKLPQLEEFYRQRNEFMKLRMSKPAPAGGSPVQIIAGAVAGKVADDKNFKSANKFGEWSRDVAAGELSRLDGWMKSLIESEMGLNSLLSPGYSGAAINFAVKRSSFITNEAPNWGDRMFILLTR